MKERKSFGDQLEAFFEGKGFYIVLFLCAAVIGVSAWVLMMGTNVEDKIGDIKSAGVVVSPVLPETTAKPAESAAPTPTNQPTNTPVVLTESENVAQVWNENSEQAEEIFIWPVSGQTVTPYAVDNLIYDRTMEDWRVHGGIDISADLGEHVLAVSGGEVAAVINDTMYGTTVIIRHADGLESIYSNLASQPTVYEGDKVKVGQVIGGVGDTAICESALSAHLHFSMRKDGDSVNPENYLP